MSQSRFAAIILAAGSGTRMKSAMPKVIHPIAGQPMIAHLLRALEPLRPAATVVVIGPHMDDIGQTVAPAQTAVQDPPLGTGDAVRTGLRALDGQLAPQSGIDEVLVLYGDTPLLRSETLARLLTEQKRAPAAILLAGMRPADPGPYGRLVSAPDGRTLRIVEAADATLEEYAIELVWGGLMLVRACHIFELVEALDRNNAKSEFYLTSIVGLATDKGLQCRAVELPAEELIGINTRAELAEAEALMQRRLRRRAMDLGVTLVAPETVYLSADTRFGRDVVVEPNVTFGPGVTVGEGARICSFSYFEGATIGVGARVGPFARLRPGAVLEEEVHVGNFVEVKAAGLGRQGQSPHLYRRRRGRRAHQHRRRHDYLQLRRFQQTPDDHWRRRLYRLEYRTGRAGDGWRQGDRRGRQRRYQRCLGGRAVDCARAAGRQARTRRRAPLATAAQE